MTNKQIQELLIVAKRRLFLAWASLDKKTRQKIVKTNLIQEFEEKKNI